MFKPEGTSVRKETHTAPARPGSAADPPRVAGLRGSGAQEADTKEDLFMWVGGRAGVGFSQAISWIPPQKRRPKKKEKQISWTSSK